MRVWFVLLLAVAVAVATVAAFDCRTDGCPAGVRCHTGSGACRCPVPCGAGVCDGRTGTCMARALVGAYVTDVPQVLRIEDANLDAVLLLLGGSALLCPQPAVPDDIYPVETRLAAWALFNTSRTGVATLYEQMPCDFTVAETCYSTARPRAAPHAPGLWLSAGEVADAQYLGGGNATQSALVAYGACAWFNVTAYAPCISVAIPLAPACPQPVDSVQVHLAWDVFQQRGSSRVYQGRIGNRVPLMIYAAPIVTAAQNWGAVFGGCLLLIVVTALVVAVPLYGTDRVTLQRLLHGAKKDQ